MIDSKYKDSYVTMDKLAILKKYQQVCIVHLWYTNLQEQVACMITHSLDDVKFLPPF